MAEVTLYTRRDCPLCDKAKAAIDAARVPHTLREVDVDGDPELRRRFGDDVPVVFVDGAEAFRHRVETDALEAVLRSAGVPPAPREAGGTPALRDEKCVPCRGGVPALTAAQIEPLLAEIADWRVVDNHHLEKTFAFPDFAQALAFTNRIGAVAEAEGHHPDIHLAWGKVRVTIWTHAIDGLTRSDFVLAAKIDAFGPSVGAGS